MGGLVPERLTHHLSPQTCPEVDEEGFTVRPDVTQNNILLAPSGGSCWHSKDRALSTVTHPPLATLSVYILRGASGCEPSRFKCRHLPLRGQG